MNREPVVPPVQAGPYHLAWGRRTYVMGVVNASPDSFAGDGLSSADDAVAQGLRFAGEGADILDVGGQSTRPGASPVDAAAEARRVLPVIERLAAATHVPISVDTSRASVARAALAAGACIVNDVTGLLDDPAMAEAVAAAGAAAVVMANHRLTLPAHLLANHRLKPPAHLLADLPAEAQPGQSLVEQTIARWRASLAAADLAGLPRQRLIVDPGLGFGLRPERSLRLLRRLPELRSVGRPILVGPSRKGFIGHALGGLPVAERLEGTLAAVALAIAGGADVVRVHDVRATHRVRLVADAVCRAAR